MAADPKRRNRRAAAKRARRHKKGRRPWGGRGSREGEDPLRAALEDVKAEIAVHSGRPRCAPALEDVKADRAVHSGSIVARLSRRGHSLALKLGDRAEAARFRAMLHPDAEASR